MKKALIIGTYINPPYHPFQQVDRELTEILSPSFTLTVTDNLACLLSMEDAEYDLAVSYLDRFDDALPEGTADAVDAFVRHGGGLLCLHNGISLQTAPQLYALIGGKFIGHPPQEELSFLPDEKGFLKDLPGFVLSEEPYQFQMFGNEVTPLLSYTYRGESYPGGWCRSEGNGRIVFLTPGHSVQAFRASPYREMIRQCAEWAARGNDRLPETNQRRKTTC